MTDALTTPEPKRRPGRPKGIPRSPNSGRKRGEPNKVDQFARDVIKEGAPLDFLCKVAQGRKMLRADETGGKKRVPVYPTMDQSLRAAEILSRKVLPDLRATELTGADGGPMAVTLLDFLKGLPA